MPESERLAVIDKIIEQVKKEEEEAKALAEKEAYLAEQEAKGTGIDRPGTETGGITLPTTSGGSGFYFYNPQAVSQGKAAFQRKWGRRALEDDWRRRKKEMSTFNENMADETDFCQKERWANWLPIRSRPDWNLLLPMTRKHVSITFSSFR